MIRTTFFLLILSIFLTSCVKEEGEGGGATIIGKVFAYDYDAEMINYRTQYYAPDEDVYIIYGDDSIFNDRTRTGHDGAYRFKFLRPGTYTIFVYSKNLQTKLPPEIPVFKTVTIVSNNEVVSVEDIEIIK